MIREWSGESFCLGFDDTHPLLRFYSFVSRINLRLFTCGDQALFFRRDVFGEIGGYADLPIMEDLEIQKRIRPCGRFVKIRRPVN